jgi:hypothetical protein
VEAVSGFGLAPYVHARHVSRLIDRLVLGETHARRIDLSRRMAEMAEEGWMQREIADHFGVTEAAVNGRIHRWRRDHRRSQ